MPTVHRRYGGSTIARTIECPGWAKLAASIPGERVTSEAAEQGTALHEAMEHIVRNDWSESNIISAMEYRVFNGISITQDHIIESLLPAYRALVQLGKKYNFTFTDAIVEPFVELIPGTAGGSIDLLAVSRDGRTAVVIDYKFGYHPVSAENNKQTLFYALCADTDPATTEALKDVEDLVLAIIQPANATEENENGLDVWETPISVLDKFEADVAHAIHIAESPNPPLCAGDHCKFCPAMPICPIKTGEAQAALKLPPEQLDHLAEWLPKLNDLEAFIRTMRELAHQVLDQGGSIEGWKLVDKRATRKWQDADAVEQKLKNMRGISGGVQYDTKLKTPAQMEKLFKAKKLDFSKITDYIVSESSGTTLAPASDKRPAAFPAAAFAQAMQRLD